MLNFFICFLVNIHLFQVCQTPRRSLTGLDRFLCFSLTNCLYTWGCSVFTVLPSWKYLHTLTVFFSSPFCPFILSTFSTTGRYTYGLFFRNTLLLTLIQAKPLNLTHTLGSACWAGSKLLMLHSSSDCNTKLTVYVSESKLQIIQWKKKNKTSKLNLVYFPLPIILKLLPTFTKLT